MSKPKENTWSNYALRIIVNTASHPLEYAKVLIQIGHEPIAPKSSTTLFGKPALKLPNVFQYVKYIKTTDGFYGCYRGLTPKLCGNLVSAVASQKILEKMEMDNHEPLDDEAEMNEELKRQHVINNIKRDLISRTTAIIVSHPFHVISIRMMAQFVGQETKYNGLFTSIVEVYRENGIGGFFSGLIPRVLGDALSIVLAHVLSYLVNTYVFDEKDLHMYTTATMSFIASAITYPFQVVSNCMAVTGSGLKAGMPPNMPIYSSWIDCWQHLSAEHQLKRGSSLLVRYYSGPQIIIGGRAVPVASTPLKMK
ncbi:mitochondrial carrier homolog 2 [Agrilus planipennis]|uniref:Mitochondrial carrier homolog 2 n=1 Tax=Agrilus planipennis TaxID=224129 RepID=A0A1W4WAE0_AGRPL|nr:mitochondrial carrier homolog 2 [Agrilus planipennis]XP_025836841.1 mitochondrial carrier homolog 2 [Agrilus planipennis]